MPEIQQRRLGRTNLMVNEIGLGARDTPNSPAGAQTLRTAENGGINFVDTAREYSGSEFLIGQHVRELGKTSFLLASKTFSRNINGSQRDIDKSIATLGVKYLPLYQLHDISSPESWAEVCDENEGALAGLKIAQFRGLINHIGVSSHNTKLLEELIKSNEFDTVMLEYSAFYPDTAAIIDLAVEYDIGVIVMRPVGGSGRASAIRTAITDGYNGPLTPANLLRYVLANPGVSVAIPGTRYPSHVIENIATAIKSTPMSKMEAANLEAEAARLY